jgi:predicted RNA-binding protein with EMAP domain
MDINLKTKTVNKINIVCMESLQKLSYRSLSLSQLLSVEAHHLECVFPYHKQINLIQNFIYRYLKCSRDKINLFNSHLKSLQRGKIKDHWYVSLPVVNMA